MTEIEPGKTAEVSLDGLEIEDDVPEIYEVELDSMPETVTIDVAYSTYVEVYPNPMTESGCAVGKPAPVGSGLLVFSPFFAFSA